MDSKSKSSSQDLPLPDVSPSLEAGPANQTRPRRLFSTLQLFAYSLTFMSIWEGMVGNMFSSLYNGGPNTFLFSVVIVFTGVMAQAASLGELASILPLAGAQYHWTWHLAPRRIRRFATWIQGWSTWFGYVAALASVTYVFVLLLQSIVVLNHPDYEPQGWQLSLMIIALSLMTMGFNMYCIKLIPLVETVIGILHVIVWLVFVVVLVSKRSHNGADFIFLEKNISSGWEDRPFVSWNIGMITAVWCFTGESLAYTVNG